MNSVTTVEPTESAARSASSEATFANYKRLPVAFSHGRGVSLWDESGKEYLDFLGGLAATSLGHSHPTLVGAIQQQAEKVLHVSNLFQIPEQEAAAEAIVASTRCGNVRGFDRVFFCNSGAEAIEALLKLARKWRSEHKPSANQIVVATDGFHGRTMGALAATGTPAYHAGFEPLPGGFRHIPFNDTDALEGAVDDDTIAVLLEPIQGEAGVFPADEAYLKRAEQLCREHNALFLLDEVQTGVGRTGSHYAYQSYGVTPDAIALAKGLGGGVPVGAVCATESLASHLVPGTHGTTFGGNPLASAAVSAVLSVVDDEDFLEHVRTMGALFRSELEALAERSGKISEVRGRGLMVAVELTVDAPAVAASCLERGLILNAPRPHSVRFLPPLVVEAAEIQRAVEVLEQALLESA